MADRRRSGTSFAARGGAIRAGIPGRSRGQDEDLLPSRSDPVEETRGEVLIVTERVEMVLPLRHGLLAHRYDLVWISNFWLAMSYLHSSRFVSLIFDMDVESVEERFVMYFLEEYEKISSGRKIFLSSGTTSVAIQRQLQEKGHLVLDRHAPPEDLVRRVAQGSGVSG
ncbi:hypothetical protein HQ520_07870 [bacterium]|nr:hypothetical protein [bacterium]